MYFFSFLFLELVFLFSIMIFEGKQEREKKRTTKVWPPREEMSWVIGPRKEKKIVGKPLKIGRILVHGNHATIFLKLFWRLFRPRSADQIALRKKISCASVCVSVCLCVCLLICQSLPNGWRWTPQMGYHRITNFMKNVLGIIFCPSVCLSVCLAGWLAVWLAGCLEIFAFIKVFALQWTPKGSLASKNNI